MAIISDGNLVSQPDKNTHLYFYSLQALSSAKDKHFFHSLTKGKNKTKNRSSTSAFLN